MIGAGAGITSFIHIDDAASAVVAALAARASAIYNIADNEPARASEWMPAYAEALGAPPPRRVPEVLARFVLGRAMTAWITTMRGASNAKARRHLPWRLRFPSWRTGFRESVAP
jgi:nucleoside-diphosphate-sugar epimerase